MDAVYDQQFLDRDGQRLGLQVYPEPPVAGAPAVVVWPAMGVPARYYRPFAAELRAAGLAVAVADLRGTGASTPAPSRRSRYGYAELAGDVGAVLDHLDDRLDGRRVILLGHSLGGQVCALHLANPGDPRVAGLVFVAVGLPWFRSYPGRRAREVLAFTQSIAAASAVLRIWPGWGFGGRQARGVIRDWGYTARHGRFPLPNADQDLARVSTPVLAISIERDRYTPARTTDQLCAAMPSAPVERVHLTAAHLGDAAGHITWVRAAAPIAARVAQFAAGPAAFDQR